MSLILMIDSIQVEYSLIVIISVDIKRYTLILFLKKEEEEERTRKKERKNSLFITACAHVPHAVCVAPVCAALWFSIGALLARRGIWLVPLWVCATTHLTVGNPRWPARIVERHWPGIFSLLYYKWLALVSSSRNAEVTQSTESPLCQLILPEWVTRFIPYN